MTDNTPEPTPEMVEAAISTYRKESLTHCSPRAMAAALRAALSVQQRAKVVTPATIAELDALLNSESDEPVEVMPDGPVQQREARPATAASHDAALREALQELLAAVESNEDDDDALFDQTFKAIMKGRAALQSTGDK